MVVVGEVATKLKVGGSAKSSFRTLLLPVSAI
jgi:hypothetical protein